MKKIIIAMAVAGAFSLVTAQDYDSYSESFVPSVTLSGEGGADARAWLDTENGYADDRANICNNTEMDSRAYAKLNVNYEGESSDTEIKLNFDSKTLKSNPEDIVEELTARGYFGNWTVEGGKMKVVWGKGDKLHVFDNFNANNYTDFIFPDYVDRRLSEVMFRVAYNVPNESNLRVEAIVTPMMTADRFATSGTLVPYAQQKLTDTVTSIVKNNTIYALNQDLSGGAITLSGFDAINSASSFSSDDLYENSIKSLKYAQGGAKVSGSLGSLDWGLSYYYGHYKQPSANLEKYITSLVTAAAKEHSTEVAALAAQLIANGYDATTATTLAAKKIGSEYASTLAHDGTYELELPSLDYDRLQVFGFEFAKILWKFNCRGEFAYNLTEDVAGDNPWVKNNSLTWVGGFDIDLPIHNLNINVQETGTYILKNNKIEDGAFKAYDVDYNSDGNYCINKVVLNVSDKWINEKLSTECMVIYGIENEEWCVQPKIEYNVVDGFTVTAKGAYLYSKNENGEFYNFTADSTKNHSKAFAQLSVKYAF